MDGIEEKLNMLLNDPASLGRIMELAQQLSGAVAPKAEPAAPAEGSEIDPKLLARLLPLLRELGKENSSARELLYALRPYLKPERQEKVEQAMRLAHLIHISKKMLTEGGWDLV